MPDDDLIVLYPGNPAEDDTWRPHVALEQADRNGVGVIVGETVEGYVEGIDAETFEGIRQHIISREEAAKVVGTYLWETLEIESAEAHVRHALGLPVEEG